MHNFLESLQSSLTVRNPASTHKVSAPDEETTVLQKSEEDMSRMKKGLWHDGRLKKLSGDKVNNEESERGRSWARD